MIKDLKDRNKKRTGHFITHWGAPKDIKVKSFLTDNEIAFITFPPKGDRLSWRCATNGMSEYIQHTGEESVRTELYACI